jgi:esterase/lipase
MSMEVLESLLQLRKLHKDLLDAFDKLNSPLEIVQKVRDVISDLPDAHAVLKL